MVSLVDIYQVDLMYEYLTSFKLNF